VIQQRLQNSLANEILAEHFPEGSTICIDGTMDGFVSSTKASSPA